MQSGIYVPKPTEQYLATTLNVDYTTLNVDNLDENLAQMSIPEDCWPFVKENVSQRLSSHKNNAAMWKTLIGSVRKLENARKAMNAAAQPQPQPITYQAPEAKIPSLESYQVKILKHPFKGYRTTKVNGAD